MDSRESKSLAPPPQSQQHSQPQMMIGPPNMYSHGGLFNGTSSPPPPVMQNPCFSLSPPGQSAPMAVESLNPQFAGRSTSQEGPPGFSGDTGKQKKKRGRPRKYPLDSNIGLGLTSDSGPCSPSASPLPSSVRATNNENSNVGTPGSDPPVKKNKGRPPSSGKKQMDALGSSGFAFTPHVLLVEAGEDITEKINAFSMEGPRNVCIISANGSICNATLLQPALSDRAVTYEGRFQILSFTGAFSPPESNGSLGGSTTIFVSLAGSDGRVLGGGVMGKLIAATQVQVIIGSFIAEGGAKKQTKSGISPTTMSKPVTAESPASEGPTTASSHENGGSPSAAPFAQQHHQAHNMSVYSSMGWGNSTMKM
ncbi:AT-hook motif nuclear-localized protein 8-like [Impatiens glandulifera]|uniref:AT-hook motif nuclear-localized protein 8-like n=1 Tax=Impatiens glandulifera TaxID=253017 RepID=UPI001FB0D2AC|nr:AT-hook motif nuclear-localized protein 8-like [Impatiens glandulifera]